MAQLHDVRLPGGRNHGDVVRRDAPELQTFTLVVGERTAANLLAEREIAAARAAGWTIVEGWAAPLTGDRVICVGWVGQADDARRALLAAVAGAGLIVGVRPDLPTLDRLLDDLRRLGTVRRLATGR